jgi:hypothetical protein
MELEMALPRYPFPASRALALAIGALTLGVPLAAIGTPLCPPARPARQGESILLDFPANVRAAPGARILWTVKSGLDRIVALRAQGDWWQVRVARYPTDERPHPAPLTGWVHLSNVQPVCVITSDRDLAALGRPPPLVRLERGDEESRAIELRAFGHAARPAIAVQHPFDGEYLFETGDAQRPLAYLVNSDDMTAGALLAFGPDGPQALPRRETFEGRISLERVRPGGEISIYDEYACLPLLRTVAVRGGGFVTVATRFADRARAQTVPEAADPARICSMRTPSGEVKRLAPGEALELEGLSPDGRLRVHRAAGGNGTIDPELADVCLRNRLCAG